MLGPASPWQQPGGCHASDKLFLSSIQAGDAERVGRPSYFGESGALHPFQHLFRFGKSLDGCRQIRVGAANSRDHGSHSRQDFLEVEAIETAHHTLGFPEVENAALASRAQHAKDLTQSGVVIRKIAEAEG